MSLMSPATATVRIAPIGPAIETLETVVTTSTDPAEIAAAILDAASALVPCSGGMLLVGCNDSEFEIIASTAGKRYPLGRRMKKPLRTARGALKLSLRARGEDFGHVVLFDAKAPSGDKAQMLDRVLAFGAVILPLSETESLRNRLTETNAIVEVGQVLTGLLAMDDVLSYVVYLAESLVRGNCATIALLSDERDHLVLKNSTGSLRGAEGNHIPVTDSLMGWVVENSEPVVTRNVSDDPRSFQLDTRQGPGLVVPVQINGETIGAFLVARLEDAEPFTPENLETLQRMSSYAAIAIHNAHLYREQTDAAETLREQAGELQEAYSELNRQQDQLIVSEKMAALGRITAGIAHEINSPLGGIMNALRTAKGYVEEYKASAGDPEITAEDHAAIAADILSALGLAENAAAKVAQFVRSIKTQTRPGEGHRTEFDPAAEIDATITLLQHRLKKESVGVYTDLEKDLSLTGDQGKFALIIQNLVVNAIDAYDGEPGEIWVRLSADESRAVVEVEDKGCGIPEELRGRIFDYLFTTKDVGKGTGLGLAMVHSVVTGDFTGEIELESEVGKGTTFRVYLPLTPKTE